MIMIDRYHVGNTPHNRQCVRDDRQGTLVCIAVTAGRAEEIADALNAVAAVPQKFQLQADGTYPDSGQPHISIRQWHFEHLDLSDKVVTNLATVTWLDQVFQFLRQAGREEWPAEAVPVPPWRQQ